MCQVGYRVRYLTDEELILFRILTLAKFRELVHREDQKNR